MGPVFKIGCVALGAAVIAKPVADVTQHIIQSSVNHARPVYTGRRAPSDGKNGKKPSIWKPKKKS